MSGQANTKTPSDLYERSQIYQTLAFFFRHPSDTGAQWIKAADYEKYFGHTVNTVAPGYELEYGEAHSHREPQALADITAFYHAFGLRISQESHERPDHASVECEFMSYLLYKEAIAVEACRGGSRTAPTDEVLVTREASANFLKIHLGYWFPSFAKRLAKISDGLVKDVADFSFEFVTEHCRALGIQTGPADLPVRTVQEKEDSGCVSCEFNTTPHS